MHWVQSAGFLLKTQPRLLLLPISSHGLTTATVSSWVRLILSSNHFRKFKILLQDSFFWHPATNTQLLSWRKKCSGFPFQNVLNIKSLVCVSMLQMVLVLLTSLNCYVSTFRLVHYALLLTPHAENPAIQMQDSWLSHFLLLLGRTFGIHSHKTLDTARPCYLLKPS